jgi:class 3 adenylate cyclase
MAFPNRFGGKKIVSFFHENNSPLFYLTKPIRKKQRIRRRQGIGLEGFTCEAQQTPGRERVKFPDYVAAGTDPAQLDPVHLVRLLNRYLSAMGNIIMENLGTMDKYEGDAIIAFFGAPVYREEHTALACRRKGRL